MYEVSISCVCMSNACPFMSFSGWSFLKSFIEVVEAVILHYEYVTVVVELNDSS